MFHSILAALVTLAVAVSTLLLIVTLAAARRRTGSGGAAVHDTSEAAFLTGGPGRAVDTALTALHTDGRLSVGGPGVVVLHSRAAHDTVERALVQEYDAAPHGALHTLRYATMRHPAVQEIGDELAARGLLLAPQETRTWRRWGMIQGVVCLLGLPVAGAYTAYATLTGLDSRLPSSAPVPLFVLVLPALFVGMVLGFVMASRAKRRLTTAGRTALLAYHSDDANLWSPSQQVAVGGTRTLTDPDLRAQFHAAIRTGPHPAPAPAPSQGSTSAAPVPVWCAGTIPGSGPGTSCGGSGSGCGGSSCSGGGGGWGGGSSCSSGSGSSCSSSSSSCGGSSSSSSCSSSS